MYMTTVPRARRLAFLLQQNIKSGRPRTSSPSLAAAAVVGLESLLNGSLQTLGDPSQPHRRASFWSRKPAPDGAMSESEEYKVQKTESEWKAALTAEEYRVLRQKGTERAGTGEYDKFYPEDGYFVCRACQVQSNLVSAYVPSALVRTKPNHPRCSEQNPLYSSTAKFNSGCGWPVRLHLYPIAFRFL